MIISDPICYPARPFSSYSDCFLTFRTFCTLYDFYLLPFRPFGIFCLCYYTLSEFARQIYPLNHFFLFIYDSYLLSGTFCLCDFLGPLAIVYGILRSSSSVPIFGDQLRSFLTICGYLRLFASFYDHLQRFLTQCTFSRTIVTFCRRCTLCDLLRAFTIHSLTLRPFGRFARIIWGTLVFCSDWPWVIRATIYLRPFATFCDFLRLFARLFAMLFYYFQCCPIRCDPLQPFAILANTL